MKAADLPGVSTGVAALLDRSEHLASRSGIGDARGRLAGWLDGTMRLDRGTVCELAGYIQGYMDGLASRTPDKEEQPA